MPTGAPRTFVDDGDGYFQYVQTIKVLDTQNPVLENPGDQYFCDYSDGCEGNVSLSIDLAEDNCSEQLTYDFAIDFHNDDSFDVEGEGRAIGGVYEYGTHAIRWRVSDGCGNQDVVHHLFTIADCKNPTPVCLDGLSAPINNNGDCVEIWATDLFEYAFDNCTNVEAVEASVLIAKAGDGANAASSIFLCCEDISLSLIHI